MGGVNGAIFIGNSGNATFISSGGKNIYFCNNTGRFAVSAFNLSNDKFAIKCSSYSGSPIPGQSPTIITYAGAGTAANNAIVVDTILHVTTISSSNVHFAFVTNNIVRQLLYCASGNWSNSNNYSIVATTNNIAIASLTANNFMFV